jgi:hypothetical protein
METLKTPHPPVKPWRCRLLAEASSFGLALCIKIYSRCWKCTPLLSREFSNLNSVSSLLVRNKTECRMLTEKKCNEVSGCLELSPRKFLRYLSQENRFSWVNFTHIVTKIASICRSAREYMSNNKDHVLLCLCVIKFLFCIVPDHVLGG